MNHISSGFLGIASILVTGSIVFSGCGLRDFNNSYTEPVKDLGLDNAEDMPPPPDEETKAWVRNQQPTVAQQPRMGDEQQPSMANQQQPSMPEQQQPSMMEQQPPMQQGTPQRSGGGGCPVSRPRAQPQQPTRFTEAPLQTVPASPPPEVLPPGFVQEPDLVNPLPPIVRNTNEVRPVTRVVDHLQNVFQPQEQVNVVNIFQPYTERHRLRQRIINAPRRRTVVNYSTSTNIVREVVPPETMNLPPVDDGVSFGWN